MRTVALAVLALVAAGCMGGDGDDRLSEEEYLREADAICASYDERLNSLPEPTNLTGLERVAGQALALASEGVERLRALKPPEELQAQVDEWIERNEENVRKIRELREAAAQKQAQRVQELASAAADNEDEADALAKEIGLRACAASG